ncbi:hypothetical protein [Streptomyces sp. NRRL F-5755]|uniref:hypothetical protein n=1 Tax=Streptomyces sp. NRRL F-5755 TaxID=1519475 RepID=UPI001331A19A|nr:hypothetical protein [Streptomyces sp. NRRL F-5755]
MDSLPVKGFPQTSAGDRRLRTVQQIYDRAGVLAHIACAPDEGYALTDKASPHAVHELMMISAGRSRRPGLDDHSAAFGRALGVVAGAFALHCADNDLSPALSWSYDPHTLDRPSIQGEKRFHAHLIGRTPAEQAAVAQQAVPAADLDPLRRRRIVEEASVLGALLTADCVDPDALRVLRPVAALSSPASTCAAVFGVPGGWGALADPGVHEDLVYVHRKLRRAYEEISRACLTGTAGPWRRPAVDADRVQDVRLPLSPRSRSALGHYLSALRPDLTPQGPATAQRARIIHTYPLAWLAYAVTITEFQGSLAVYVRVNVFSDLGGAGVTIMDGTVVKIRKGVGALRPAEIDARACFQNQYLDRLCRHPQAGYALFPRQS